MLLPEFVDSRVRESASSRLSEGVEAARMGFVVSADGLDEAGIKSAVRFTMVWMFSGHYRDQFTRIAQVCALRSEGNAVDLVGGNGNVGMEINDRVP